MANQKETSRRITRLAARILADHAASEQNKHAAGSALVQARKRRRKQR